MDFIPTNCAARDLMIHRKLPYLVICRKHSSQILLRRELSAQDHRSLWIYLFVAGSAWVRLILIDFDCLCLSALKISFLDLFGGPFSWIIWKDWMVRHKNIKRGKMTTWLETLIDPEDFSTSKTNVLQTVFLEDGWMGWGTYYGKMQELVHLLQSVALFWPSDWGVLLGC